MSHGVAVLLPVASLVLLVACGPNAPDDPSEPMVSPETALQLSPTTPSVDEPSESVGTPAAVGPLEVSGSEVSGLPFGSSSDDVLRVMMDRLGKPDFESGPNEFFPVAGERFWFEDADDPLSLRWQYPLFSVSCWQALCLLFGGDKRDALALRGWELSTFRSWDGFKEVPDAMKPNVVLAGSGIRLGATWETFHAAYPNAVIGGGEGYSVVIDNPPWDGVFDGVWSWRLSGIWDPDRPTVAPADAVVIRMSGGEGPEPGCC